MHVINEEIYIGSNILHTISSIIPLNNHKVLVVTEEIIAKLYLNILQSQIRGLEYLILPGGEENKTLATLTQILQKLSDGYDRNTTLIAFGGGVIGDLSGFAASIFMRGVRFIQIPTTLLAQVDAGIGGKNGCNFLGVKNLIGTFYKPEHVIIDIDVLESLPKRDFIAGLAEVVKYGMALDADFFGWLCSNKVKILNKDKQALSYMVARCCESKQQIVTHDPSDKGLRLKLNFGHTFAHAIEAATGFRYLHGEAVAIGMLLATHLAVKIGILSQEVYAKLVKLLDGFGLPIQLDLHSCSPEMLFNYIMHDKKRAADKINFVLPNALGSVVVSSLGFANMEDFISLCLRNSMIVIGDNV